MLDGEILENRVQIHQLAMVHPSCTIGVGTTIWQFASILRGAQLGRFCTVGGCAVVDGATIGDECSISHGSQIHPGAELGNKVFVGPGAIICNDLWPSVEKVGFELTGQAIVKVMDKVSIGAGAIILPGITLHIGSFVAAGAVVDVDVGPDMIFRRDRNITRVPADWYQRRMRYAL